MVYTTGVRSKNMNHQRCQKTGAKKTINGICSGGCRIENAVHNEPIVNGDVILLGLSLLSWERGRGIVQPSDFGAKSKDTEQRYPQWWSKLLSIPGFDPRNPSLKIGYPLVNIQKAMENGPVEIVSFPMNSMVDLSIVFCKRLPGATPKIQWDYHGFSSFGQIPGYLHARTSPHLAVWPTLVPR